MLFKTRLFDEILVTFVALVRERDSVRVLLMLKPPAAGGEGGAADRAQGSPLLGLICRRGTFCWHPCILRGQHILSWKRIRITQFLVPFNSNLTGFFLQTILCFWSPFSVLNSILQNLHGSTLMCSNLCLKWFNRSSDGRSMSFHFAGLH